MRRSVGCWSSESTRANSAWALSWAWSSRAGGASSDTGAWARRIPASLTARRSSKLVRSPRPSRPSCSLTWWPAARSALDAPMQDLLGPEVRMPTREGAEITAGHLATHSSGLPRLPDNFKPEDPANPYADYDADRLHAFLSTHELSRDIGERVEYSNLGVRVAGLRARPSDGNRLRNPSQGTGPRAPGDVRHLDLADRLDARASRHRPRPGAGAGQELGHDGACRRRGDCVRPSTTCSRSSKRT